MNPGKLWSGVHLHPHAFPPHHPTMREPPQKVSSANRCPCARLCPKAGPGVAGVAGVVGVRAEGEESRCVTLGFLQGFPGLGIMLISTVDDFS